MTPGSRPHTSLSIAELAQWAWTTTAATHGDRVNLLIHLVAVPVFVAGHVLLVVGPFVEPWLVALAPLCVATSLALQKAGHARDAPVVPFANGRDFVRRIYVEQFWNFWRFFFTGEWSRSFRQRR